MPTQRPDQPTPVDLHGHLAAPSTDSAGIDLPPDRSQDRRGAHPRHDRQRTEAGRVRLERRRSPQADTNVGSITTEISGRRLHEEWAASRTPGLYAQCAGRSCKPSVRRSPARRDPGHSTRASLTATASCEVRDSPPCSHLHRHGVRSRVPNAVTPPVSPSCLAGMTLSPQPKAPRMPQPIALDSCPWPHHGRMAAAGESWRRRRLVGLADEGG